MRADYNNSMIGIFDSGVGGLSVLRQLKKKAPQANVVYFGDTENAPYGTKSQKELANLTSMALRRLLSVGATDIISACNSVSVSVMFSRIDLLRIKLFDMVEMVQPSVSALAPSGKKILVFGTLATTNSGLYQQAFEKAGVKIDALPIPELAGAIERDDPSEIIEAIVSEAVSQALKYHPEIIALCCTHYPFVMDVFKKCVDEQGSKAVIFDPAFAVVDEVLKRFNTKGGGFLRFLVSKDTPVFRRYVEDYFGSYPHSIEVSDSIVAILNTV